MGWDDLDCCDLSKVLLIFSISFYAIACFLMYIGLNSMFTNTVVWFASALLVLGITCFVRLVYEYLSDLMRLKYNRIIGYKIFIFTGLLIDLSIMVITAVGTNTLKYFNKKVMVFLVLVMIVVVISIVIVKLVNAIELRTVKMITKDKTDIFDEDEDLYDI